MSLGFKAPSGDGLGIQPSMTPILPDGSGMGVTGLDLGQFTFGPNKMQMLASALSNYAPTSVKAADPGKTPPIYDDQQRAYEQYLKAFNAGKV